MVLSVCRLSTVFSLCAWVAAVFAAPGQMSNVTSPDVTPFDNDTALASSPPFFVVYWDKFIDHETGPPPPSTFKAYNVLVLSFLLSNGSADQALIWERLDPKTRANIKKQYNDAGIKLMVSAFGATDAPTTKKQDPTALANKMASWVITNGLDGIDVDYEDFDAVSAKTAPDWLAKFTTVLRQKLPAGKYTITHAPIAPWFSSVTGAPYLSVNSKVGKLIDWYNVQFYNQENMYTTCKGIVSNSGGPFTKSSVLEIAAAGVSLNKIVIGKPATKGDADNGFVDPKTLSQCVLDAKNAGWKAGVMVWQYPEANIAWMTTVRSKAFPVP